MQLILLLALLLLFFFFVQAQQVLLAFIVALLIAGDILGNFFAQIFSFIGALFSGLKSTASAEAAEMEAAKPKAPEGKKFFEEGFSSLGKKIGKGEKAKKEGKRLKVEGDFFSVLGTAAEGFLKGISSLFKK
ncbi:MAG TPA: hypothetical protein VFF09_02360 [archaeon]|nr:hypothetical protein [archaeon]